MVWFLSIKTLLDDIRLLNSLYLASVVRHAIYCLNCEVVVVVVVVVVPCILRIAERNQER